MTARTVPLAPLARDGEHATPAQPRTPYAVLEVLRMLVVVFFAGAGYQVGTGVDASRPVLGALNGTALGLVLGSGLGYVLGGVLGRKTAVTAEQARSSLREVSADTLVAGSIGLVGGVLLGAGVAWPVFFLPQAYLAFPLFGFVVVALGYLGFQLGASKRDGGLAIFGVYLATYEASFAWIAFGWIVVVSILGELLFHKWFKGRKQTSAPVRRVTAEQTIPVEIVVLHGVLAGATILLVFLVALQA